MLHNSPGVLREKYPNKEFFLFCIFPYWTEYGDLMSKSPYSVRIRENTYQEKLRVWTIFTFYAESKLYGVFSADFKRVFFHGEMKVSLPLLYQQFRNPF